MNLRSAYSFLVGVSGMVAVAAAVDCFTAHTTECCALGGLSIFSYPPCTGCSDSLSANSVSHFKMNSPPGAGGRTATATYSSCLCMWTKRWCTPQGECQVVEGFPQPHWYTTHVPEGGEPCTVPNGGGGGSPD